MNLFHFFMPLVPLALVAALFFKNRFAAYGSVILLSLIKTFLTEFSIIYFYTTVALLVSVFVIRKLKESYGMGILAIAGYSFVGITFYELFSNFGVWTIGGCVPTNPPQYAHTFSGLLQCYKASSLYSAYHFLRDIPIAVLLVTGISYVTKWISSPSVSAVKES